MNWLPLLVGGFGLVWIALEGNLAATIALALGLALAAAMRLLGRLAPNARRPWGYLLLWVGLGLAAGAATAGLTLVLMALKTGLHGHGPEFSRQEFLWVGRQWPTWSAAGFLTGLGMALVGLARRPS
ncbi:MAG: hypothetical protein ACRDHL_05995 [Candidatus Promineifilaceae bacterium]